VSNCTVDGGTIGGSNAVEIGGLIGAYFNPGDLTDCKTTCDVSSGEGSCAGFVSRFGGNAEATISGCSAKNNVTADVSGAMVGGFVKTHRYGIIEQCYSTGSIDGRLWVGGFVAEATSGAQIKQCYSKDAVTGGYKVGGFCGSSEYDDSFDKFIQNCYADGSVEATYPDYDTAGVGGFIGFVNDKLTVETSYSVGNVTGEANVGGFAGSTNANTVTDSYWDDEASTIIEGGTEVNGQSDGGTALTTGEMQGNAAKTYMTGFDFTNIWTV
jgi:hypothetical protein